MPFDTRSSRQQQYGASGYETHGTPAQLTVGDKLWGETALAGNRAEVIKQTYLLLALGVGFAIAGGVVGASSPAIINLFSGWMGWILAIAVLNIAPRIAMAARHNPVLGVTALIADGFVSGLVLAPVLYVASVGAPGVIQSALMITAIAFCGVTAYVMTTGKTFSAPRGLMTGIFFSILGVIVLNAFLDIGFLGLLISGAIGVFGVFILVYATSDVLNNPESDSPIPGALMLFAGLFNIFVAALHILLRLSSGGRD
jgi:modulator of FtsH protease